MPIITVESVDKARNFYVENLDFQHVMGAVGKDGEREFVTVVRDGARLMSACASGPIAYHSNQPVEIYREGSNVKAYLRQLQEKGVKITEPLTVQGWSDSTFKVMDPCGYVIWFYQTTGEPRP